MNVEHLISLIESVADPRYAAQWDLCGIFVRGEKEDIKKIALSLDATEEVVDKVEAWKADFLLVHHPLSLSPKLPNKDDSYTRIIRKLIKADIWLYCAHTSLDVNLKGPVSWLAHYLGLQGIKPLETIDQENEFLGFGIIGDLKKEVPFSFFMEKLIGVLNKRNIITVGKEPHLVKRVGYCPGSGMSLAEKAFLEGAQVYVSGDIKYHLAQGIEHLGYTIDVGHFILEEIMMKKWSEDLAERLKGQDVEIKFFQGEDVIFIKEV